MRENCSPAERTGGASDPPLVVPTTHERSSTRAKYYCGQTVSVPQHGDVVITEDHIMQAQMLNISVGQLLEIEPMPTLKESEIAWQYVRGKPLVHPDKVRTSQRECINCINGT